MKKILFCLTGFMFAFFNGGAAHAEVANVISKFLTGGGGFLFSRVLDALGFPASGFCWFCGIYETLFDAMNTLATNIAKNLSHDFILLLGTGLFLYIILKASAMLSRLQEVDLMQYLGELFKHVGRGIVGVGLLYGCVGIFEFLVSPFLVSTLALSIELIQDNNTFGGKLYQTGISLLNGKESTFCPDVKVLEGLALDTGVLGSGMAFSPALKTMITCYLAQVSASLILGMVIGGVIFALGWLDAFVGYLPNPQLILIGGFIFMSYFLIYLAVPFKLMDSMVRLAFVAALMPLWVVLWVFPPTVSYVKNAFDMLLNCCANFLILSVILVLVFQLLDSMLPNKEELLIALIPGHDYLASLGLSPMGSNFLLTIAIGFLCKSMVQNSSNIANQIVRSYGAGIGENLDKMMVGAAMAGGGLVAVIGRGGKRIYDNAADWIKERDDTQNQVDAANYWKADEQVAQGKKSLWKDSPNNEENKNTNTQNNGTQNGGAQNNGGQNNGGGTSPQNGAGNSGGTPKS